MSTAETAFIGRFSFQLVPFFKWLFVRYRDPKVYKIVVRKSAQLGWTQSVICTLMGFIAAVEKSTCIAMFPKDGAARNFDREKFGPMVESTPVLADLFPIRSRIKDVTTLFKSFAGGFIKFVGSNSISDLKSSSAKRLIVEEPDDCNLNLRGQGDAIKLIEERGKAYRDLKILIGGTPSIKGVSSIDDEYAQSDQCVWMVPCPDCGEKQELLWEQVDIPADETQSDPIFGSRRPELARYRCIHCASLWTDAQKNAAIMRGEAVANAPFRGVVGLSLNELYSCLHGSRMEVLAQRYLVADHEMQQGKPESMITFWNAALGRSWEYKGDAPAAEVLLERAMDYEPFTVPAGGLLLTMGVDVQGDRLAVIIRAWGRGEESWLVLWDELHGSVLDPGGAVWEDLDKLLFGRFRHACGTEVRIRATSIDSGDGNTADVVYDYVRSRRRRGANVMAIKGWSTPGKEIFTRAAQLDTNKANTKAARKGLQVFHVGTERAKDSIIESRLKLTGRGPGRFHVYKTVRADYFDQLLGEVKVPSRDRKASKVWQKKSGARVEALDCEVYALHAARSLKTHLAREDTWALLEAKVKQGALFEMPSEATEIDAEQEQETDLKDTAMPDKAPEEPVTPAPAPFVTSRSAPVRRGGNFATKW